MPGDVLVLLLIGAAALVFGVHCIANRTFPRWMTGSLLWPLDRVTPSVVIAEGWASVVVGAAALAYPFATFAPDRLHAPFIVLTVAALVLSVGLVCLAVWLSRRPAQQRP